jgi:RNA polymerase sigma-70 factor (ECF subfamily)
MRVIRIGAVYVAMSFFGKHQTSSESPTVEQMWALSDEKLMIQLARGNHDSLGVIFNRYQRVVMRVAMQVLRDPTEAEDLMQSVFLQILEDAQKYDSTKGSLRVWILQYAYHRAFNRRKYLSIRGKYDANDTDESQPFDPADPRKPALILESAHLIRKGLAQLSEVQRQTLELAFFDGLTMSEIAEKTGESFASVRHHYYRGLEKLRTILGMNAKKPAEDSSGPRKEAYVQS